MSPTERPRSQHHKRLAWLTAAVLGIAATAGLCSVLLPRNDRLIYRLTAPDLDGEWRFVGPRARYMLRIREGEIVGGYDGCNAWGFSQTLDDTGERMVVSDAQGCNPKPFHDTYRRFAFGNPHFELEGDALVVSVPDHRAVLVRETR